MPKNLPRVTDILRGAGLADFSRVPPSVLKAAQHFGTASHLACELWDRGTLNIEILDPNLVPILTGWKNFLSDFKIVIDPAEIEKQFISKKYGFCGSPDRWPLVGKKRRIVDIKTGIYQVAHELQTMGYKILVEESGLPVHDERWGVYLKEDGLRNYTLEIYKDPSDKTVFLSSLNLYNYKKRKGLL